MEGVVLALKWVMAMKHASQPKELLWSVMSRADTMFAQACVSNVMPEITSDKGEVFAINDGIVVQQGPNYALAKRLQHWRAMLARYVLREGEKKQHWKRWWQGGNRHLRDVRKDERSRGMLVSSGSKRIDA